MTWLAPWALGAGALGMLGVVAAHLLSRQRPRAVALATARFLPTGMLEATTLQPIPIDRWWMLLRLLIIALLALGVAQPVLTGTKVPSRTVLLLDRSLPLETQRDVLTRLGATDVVIPFDTGSTLQAAPAVVPAMARDARLSGALGRLVRARDSLAERSTTFRVAIASRFGPSLLDPATAEIRALLPDSIAVMPVTVPTDSGIVRGAIAVQAGIDDPIAATAHLLGDSVAPAGARIQRGDALTLEDSVAARDGATVTWWPARPVTGAPPLQALTVGSHTWVAPLARDSTADRDPGQVVGWWAGGEPAVRRSDVGRGCILTVRAGVPVAGDQTLSLAAQAWLTSLVTRCDRQVSAVGQAPSWLASPQSRLAPTPAQAMRFSRIAPWLVGAALVLACLELVLRSRQRS